MSKNDTTTMSKSEQEQEHESEWGEIVAEVIEEDRELLDALAD